RVAVRRGGVHPAAGRRSHQLRKQESRRLKERAVADLVAEITHRIRQRRLAKDPERPAALDRNTSDSRQQAETLLGQPAPALVIEGARPSKLPRSVILTSSSRSSASSSISLNGATPARRSDQSE